MGSEPLRIKVLSSRSSEKGRAAAARHIRQLLQKSVDKLEERQHHSSKGACVALPCKSRQHHCDESTVLSLWCQVCLCGALHWHADQTDSAPQLSSGLLEHLDVLWKRTG